MVVIILSTVSFVNYFFSVAFFYIVLKIVKLCVSIERNDLCIEEK